MKTIGGFLRLSLLLCSVTLMAETRLSPLYGDNAVLQANRPIFLRGSDLAGTKVTASLGKTQGETTTGSDGLWQIELAALPAGGPYELTVKGTTSVTMRNILIGEVWLCSGQSNMKMALKLCFDGVETAQKCTNPAIRLYTVPFVSSETPVAMPGGKWQTLTPAAAENFSGLGIFLALELYQALEIPVGIIDCSMGGTLGESWIAKSFLTGESLQPILDRHNRILAEYPAAKERYDSYFAEYDRLGKALRLPPVAFNDTMTRQDPEKWSAPGFDDGTWQRFFHGNDLDVRWDGTSVMWLRAKNRFPAEWKGKKKRLDGFYVLGRADLFLNGIPIGSYSGTGKNDVDIALPEELNQADHFVFTMRVYTQRQSAGFRGIPRFRAENSPGALPLKCEFACSLEKNMSGKPISVYPYLFPPNGPGNKNSVSGVFNGMVHPVAGFPIAGVLWYQGEGNNDRGVQYRDLLPALIANWRAAWNAPALPFVIVQLPNFGMPPREPEKRPFWSELREAQEMTVRRVPETILVNSIDIGDAVDLHPKNKKELGRRAALAARQLTKKIELHAESPVFESMTAAGSTARIKFRNLNSLTIKNPPAKQIAAAGSDQVFHWAEAQANGAELEVRCPKVAEIVAVRYAWASNPDGCNLYGDNGLPVLPFRTDNWPEASRGRLAPR